MAANLVIVESPAKVKTIKKFLGSNYQVAASNGHVRDLPKSQLGVDIAHDFEPKYITIRGKGELLSELRKEVKKAKKVYLATDPDREGEAISWHLKQALNLQEGQYTRISFNEITKDAVKESIKHPRDIDQNLVDAQQARRVMDRIVGYQISPILWTKVKRGLSAGRVQSVALRIICDRESEIAAFVPEEYWTLDAKLGTAKSKRTLTAHYYGTPEGKVPLKNEAQVHRIMEELDAASYIVREVKRTTRTKNPPPPFTTSTLQQEAARQLNYSTQKTMRLAQQLYEGVSIRGHGTIALITYLRTDSTRVSDTAQAAAKTYIEGIFGKEYMGLVYRTKKASGNVQDAHEAIRPTDISLLPSEISDALPRDLLRLYQLIWRRFTASRMSPARYEVISAKISCGRHIFTVSDQNLVFDGYLKVYSSEEEKAQRNLLLSSLEEGMELALQGLDPKQHFTQPPDHYTEATLVRRLEELGIGRPSTYAPTITTILSRHYVAKEKKSLIVTEIGEVVNGIMTESFPDIVDLNFTAKIESQLDEVEQGSIGWKEVLRGFYPDFEKELKAAESELEKVQIHDEETDEICEKCGRHMVIKYGPHGKFLACPGFPECHNTRPFLERSGIRCPKCGRELIVRRTKKGRRYYGCEGYPDCDYISWQKPQSGGSAAGRQKDVAAAGSARDAEK